MKLFFFPRRGASNYPCPFWLTHFQNNAKDIRNDVVYYSGKEIIYGAKENYLSEYFYKKYLSTKNFHEMFINNELYPEKCSSTLNFAIKVL